MIPKIIHYCWFGGKPKPKLAERCIASWKRICPDFEIKEWNEENFDVNQCLYSRQAFEKKQWAFLADYARLKIIAEYGGIYFDTDVELLKSIDDLLKYDFFASAEFPEGTLISTGLGFGAVAHHTYVEEMLADYATIPFSMEDGSIDRTTCPLRNTATLTRLWGHVPTITSVIENNNEIFFPRDYFNPRDYSGFLLHKTRNTRAIHWGAASWMNQEELDNRRGLKLLKRRIYCLALVILGEKNIRRIVRMFGK